MTINQMRSYISDSYPGADWKARVASMPTNQVVAVYKSLINRKPKKAIDTVLKSEPEPHQMDIWEFLYSKAEADGLKETHTNINI